jgi:hypothetical protein
LAILKTFPHSDHPPARKLVDESHQRIYLAVKYHLILVKKIEYRAFILYGHKNLADDVCVYIQYMIIAFLGVK